MLGLFLLPGGDPGRTGEEEEQKSVSAAAPRPGLLAGGILFHFGTNNTGVCVFFLQLPAALLSLSDPLIQACGLRAQGAFFSNRIYKGSFSLHKSLNKSQVAQFSAFLF